MKHYNESKLRQICSEAKVVVSEQLEEKLKSIKISPVKTEKAIQATKNLDLEKIRAMRYAK